MIETIIVGVLFYFMVGVAVEMAFGPGDPPTKWEFWADVACWPMIIVQLFI